MVIRCLFWNAFGPRLWLWRQGRSIEYSLAPRWHSHDSVAPLATAQLSREQLFRVSLHPIHRRPYLIRETSRDIARNTLSTVSKPDVDFSRLNHDCDFPAIR
jgi:hypothetical protein